MQIVGVTGGIGSGKTTVCKIFEVLGIPVYYADDAAKRLMQENEEVVTAIKDLLGSKSYNRDGQLNRNYIAEQVFGQKEKLDNLNKIVHPATIKDSILWANQQSAPYVLKEAALLFETASFHFTDKAIGVYAPVSLRIHRTMRRSHISRNEVLKRMENQIDDEIKMRLCDFVIINDGQHELIPQALKIHQQLVG